VQRLAAVLRRLGHRVEMFELGDRGGPWRYLLAQRRVAETVRSLAPDVIHIHFGYSGLAVPRTQIPTIVTFNGDDLHGTPTPSGRLSWKSRVGILASHYAAWRAARCIAVSETLRSRLWGRALRAKTVVIRDAVDTEIFRPIPRDEARRRLDLDTKDVLIIFPHDASQPTKRVSLAQNAVEVLRGPVPTARLWVVNGRPADEMPWYYADALIVTSLREGGPTSAKEALACGIPVVSVPVGDIELLAEVPLAAVCVGDQPEALAQGLRDVIARYQSRDRVSLLPSGLTLDRAARTIEALYREVIEATRRGTVGTTS
jgi:glycosyltransferase involved in cell wall biosynthesis